MMSLRRRRDDDPILPLINIVFLLLIFFMLAGRITEVIPSIWSRRSRSARRAMIRI